MYIKAHLNSICSYIHANIHSYVATVHIGDQIGGNMNSSCILFCSFGDPWQLQQMACSFEIFKGDK